MSEHTKEPWKYEPDHRNCEQPFQMMVYRDGRIGFELTDRDFDRACACVNACAGIPTANLPNLAKPDAALIEAAKAADRRMRNMVNGDRLFDREVREELIQIANALAAALANCEVRG